MSKSDYCHSPATLSMTVTVRVTVAVSVTVTVTVTVSVTVCVSVSQLALDDGLTFLAACDGPLRAAPTSPPRGACRQGCDSA
jgi:hypothetical protein